MPIRTSIPVPTFQISDYPIRSKDQSTAFQQMDIPFFFLTDTLIQSNKVKGKMYLCIAIWTQSPVPLIRFHTFLAASDLANKAEIFKPQPPKDLGFAKTFQEV